MVQAEARLHPAPRTRDNEKPRTGCLSAAFSISFRERGAAGYWLPCMSAPKEPGEGPFFAFLAWRRALDLAARFGG